MPKLNIYVDVWPTMPVDQQSLFPTCNPTEKTKGMIRYKIVAEIDDPMDEGVNKVVKGESEVEK